MSEVIATDTPIRRTWITSLSDEELHNYIATLQERRLHAQKEYEAGQLIKEEKAAGAKRILLEKNLNKLEKAHAAALKALETMEKAAVEVQALRLVLEHM